MTKLTEPVRSGVLSTRDVRIRVNILQAEIQKSAQELIKRQNSYPEPSPEKIAFHTGRIAAAQTFVRLLNATPEEWDAIIEAESESNAES